MIQLRNKFHFLYYPTTQKVAAYYVIPSENFECLSCPHTWPSVCPSALRFQTLARVVLTDFLQTLHGHWYRGGVVWDCKWAKFVCCLSYGFDWCKNIFFLNIFRANGWILMKFCLLIHTRSMLCLIYIIFGQFFTELWPLIDVRILFMLSILWIDLWTSIKFCIRIDIDKTKIWMIIQYFSFIFKRVVALDWCWNFAYAQYLVD